MTSAVAPRVDAFADWETAPRRRRGEIAVAVALAGLLGLVLVQPWDPIPFPVFDFGGWLTILASSSSAADGFRALVVEHAREGRVNPASMAYIALNWALFEGRPVGWQLLRAVVMLGVVGASYVLFRTLGANRGAALAGAAFFVITDSARSVWILPQAIEHVATLLVLLGSVLAASYHSTARPQRTAIAIAAVLVLAIWVREPLVAAAPFVLLLALSHRGDGSLGRPTMDRRSVMLIPIVGFAVAVLNVIPVIAVRFLERTGGYASRFGPENISLDNVRNVLAALVLPVTREPLFPANALFVLAIATAAVGAGAAARRFRSMLALVATLPLCAAGIYVMWPSFPGNYALPHVPAVALAFALALTTLWGGSHMRRSLAIAAATVVIGYGALLAVNGRRQYATARFLDVDMATRVSEMPSSRMIVAVDDPSTSGDFGRGLALYAKAIRGRAPVQSTDVECGEAERILPQLPPDAVLVRPPHACGNASFGPPTISLTRATTIRDWKTLRSQRWEVSADFWNAAGAR